MEKPIKKESYITLIVFCLILIAYISRFFSIPLPGGNKLLRSVIYSILYIFWGISLYSRINHPQVRRHMVTISVLMVFWLIIRMIKFSFSNILPSAARYMWYLYYLPMLFIPLLAVLVSLAIGLPEKALLPKKAAVLYFPTAFLFLLVMMNDLHQLVFTFPEDAAVRSDSDYGYSFGYVLIVIFLLACALTILATLYEKCRLPGSRRRIILPCVPISALLVYMLLNFLRVKWLSFIAGDVTAVFCLMYAATLELCIKCGLIQTNTGYAELFMVSRLGAQITDRENAVRLASSNAEKLTAEQIISAEAHPVQADKNTVIKSQPIRFGHVLWQEDIAELVEAIEQFEENCRDLAERNRIRQENLETRKKILTLQEKNRVSDLLHRETAQQIDLIGRMLGQYDTKTDEKERRTLLAGAAVIGAYIKRYGNLLLVSERAKTADIRDLSRCFEESFINLELLGVDCLHTLPSDVTLSTKDMLYVYRGFEAAVEACLFDLRHVWINAREPSGEILLSIEFVCDTDLSPFASLASSFSCEDGAGRFTFILQKGGERE